MHIDLYLKNSRTKLGRAEDLKTIRVLPSSYDSYFDLFRVILLSFFQLFSWSFWRCLSLLYLVQVLSMSEPVFFVSLARVLSLFEPSFFWFLGSYFEHIRTNSFLLFGSGFDLIWAILHQNYRFRIYACLNLYFSILI